MVIHSELIDLRNGEKPSSIQCNHTYLNCSKPEGTHLRTNAIFNQFINVFNGVMEKK